MPRALKYLLSMAFAVLASAGLYIAWLAVATSRLENVLYARTNGELDSERWNDAISQAEALANVAGWDATTLDLVGRVFLLDAEFATTPKANVQTLRKAQGYLERAAAQRPTWPYTRLNLARAIFELDPYGPWEVELKHALDLNLRGTFLQIDLLRFRRQLGLHLTGELARAVEQNFVQALQETPGEMVGAAVELDRKEWACANPINRQVKAFCASSR